MRKDLACPALAAAFTAAASASGGTNSAMPVVVDSPAPEEAPAPQAAVAQTAPPSVRADAPRRKDRRTVEEPEKPVIPSSTVFWMDSGVGWQRVGLTTLHVERNEGGEALTGDLVPSVLSGPSLQFGLGVRWLVLTFGARLGASFFDDSSPERTDGTSQFYTVDAEIGLRIPAGRFEPMFLFAGGYSRFGGLDDAISGVGRGLDIDGGNLRLGVGFDYFFSNTWSVGARATGEVLFLARSGVPIRSLAAPQSVNTIGEAKTRLLEGEGSSAGTALAFTVGPGVHF